jgi:hypothetical protein
MLYTGNAEPGLDELLSDPVVRLLLERDKLDERAVRAQIEEAKRRLLDRGQWK